MSTVSLFGIVAETYLIENFFANKIKNKILSLTSKKLKKSEPV